MVQIKEESRLSERNLYIVLSVCLITSIMGCALMLGLTGGSTDASYVACAAAKTAGFGSITAGALVIGTFAANLVVWIGVLMIGMLSWAGRSLGLTAPRKKTDALPAEGSVKLSVS